MRHPVSYDDWLGYLDGQLDATETARVRSHIESCAECWATWQDLLAATAALREAGCQYKAACAVDGESVRRGRERVMARIRAPEAEATLEAVAGGELTVRRLRRLQHVVAPVCGAQTAFRLIVAAVGRTPVPLGAASWVNFLEQLADLTSAICGRSMARLVWQIGNSLP